MVVGYLHLGQDGHGVRRYGQLLANAAHQFCDWEVVQAEVDPVTSARGVRYDLIRAATTLGAADIVHLQYNPGVWGDGMQALYYLRLFFRHCKRPIAVTLHDVYTDRNQRGAPLSARGRGRATVKTALNSRRSLGHRCRRAFSNRLLRPIRLYFAQTLVWRWLAETTQILFVCTEEEARRLRRSVGTDKIMVIPHFVEDRNLPPDRVAARTELGLERFRVVTLLGWIHPRKGHALLVEAMRALPDDVYVVFAGSEAAENRSFTKSLVDRAKDCGAVHRLRITGPLSEAELNRYLAATDLGVCPFSGLSASGSLSTWISAGKSILASDLPQIAEYNRLVPGAIQTFSPYDSGAFACAITKALSGDSSSGDSAVRQLRDKLNIARVLDLHGTQFERIVNRFT